MTKLILSICCVIIFIGCHQSEPSLIYPRGNMVEISDSTGWNYIIETTDSPDRICQYYNKAMAKMKWILHNEIANQGGHLSFSTPNGKPITINNLKSRVMIFTDYYNVLEVRVLTDSLSNNTILVVSSKIGKSATKPSTKAGRK